jgi:hypothetical protein
VEWKKRIGDPDVRILREQELDYRPATLSGRPDQRVFDDQLRRQDWPIGTDPLDWGEVHTQSALRVEISADGVEIGERRC